jgi:hypothetical protein
MKANSTTKIRKEIKNTKKNNDVNYRDPRTPYNDDMSSKVSPANHGMSKAKLSRRDILDGGFG